MSLSVSSLKHSSLFCNSAVKEMSGQMVKKKKPSRRNQLNRQSLFSHWPRQHPSLADDDPIKYSRNAPHILSSSRSNTLLLSLQPCMVVLEAYSSSYRTALPLQRSDGRTTTVGFERKAFSAEPVAGNRTRRCTREDLLCPLSDLLASNTTFCAVSATRD